MAVVWIKTEEVHARNASRQCFQGQGSEKHCFMVYFDTTGSNDIPAAYDAMNASGVPQNGDLLVNAGSGFSGAYASTIDAAAIDGRNDIYKVTVTFSTVKVQDQPAKPSGDPSKWHVTAQGTLIPREETITSDKNQVAIANSAGDPFDPRLTVTKYDEQITVTFYTDDPDWTTIDACKGKANDASVTMTIGPTTRTFATHTFKLENVQWSMHYDTASSLILEITFTFTYKPETWTVAIDNVGYNLLVAGVSTPILDANHQPVSQPQYLNSGASAVIAPGDTIVQLSFENVSDVSFTTLLADVP